MMDHESSANLAMFSISIDEVNSKIVIQENGQTHLLDFIPGIWSSDDYYDHWGKQGYGIFDGFHGVSIFFLSMPQKGSDEPIVALRVMRGNDTVLFCHTEVRSPWCLTFVDSPEPDLISLLNSSKHNLLRYNFYPGLLPDFTVKMEDYVRWHQGDFPCDYERPELHDLFLHAGIP